MAQHTINIPDNALHILEAIRSGVIRWDADQTMYASGTMPLLTTAQGGYRWAVANGYASVSTTSLAPGGQPFPVILTNAGHVLRRSLAN